MADVEVNKQETVEDLVQSNDPAKKRVARALIQDSGLANRSWYLNLMLTALLVGGGAMFLVLLLEFWILDMNLLGDPSPVWAQMPWFLPQFLVVFLSLQTMVMGVKTGLLQAPSVWMVVVGFVAFVFDVVALIFYQRLFWQCALNRGNFKTLEDEICTDNLVELSTIAWINVLFVAHSLTAIVIGVLVFSSDGERFEELRSGIMSGFGSIRKRVKNRLSDSQYPSFIPAGSNNARLSHRKTVGGWREQ
ncbi:MAG: hypothetical protein ACTSUE_16445 [Promethearchaeota archaeon]